MGVGFTSFSLSPLLLLIITFSPSSSFFFVFLPPPFTSTSFDFDSACKVFIFFLFIFDRELCDSPKTFCLVISYSWSGRAEYYFIFAIRSSFGLTAFSLSPSRVPISAICVSVAMVSIKILHSRLDFLLKT